MKRIEDLLKEVKIRFGENWEDAEIDENTYPFDPLSIGRGCSSPAIAPDEVWGNNGLLYKVDLCDNKGKWSTAKLTQKPEMWVVERNEEHPVWGKFIDTYPHKYANEKVFFSSNYFWGADTMGRDELYKFSGFQYLTLDQWAEFYLPKIDFSIHNEKDWFFVKYKNSSSWLSKGGLNHISFCLDNSQMYAIVLFADHKDDIVELRKPTDEEMNVLYETHPEYAPPKEGDWGVFWDRYGTAKIINLFKQKVTDDSGTDYYTTIIGHGWRHFKPFSPELQEMLKKEFDNI